MASYILFVPLLLSFLVAFFVMPVWIKKANSMGLVWEDMQKNDNSKAAGSGGIVVLLAFIAGIFFFVAYRVFLFKDTSFIVELLSVLLVVVFASGVGLIDDLIGWKRGGLGKLSRLSLLLLAAVPLVAINAGRDLVAIPFIGQVSLGLLYPLFFIPLGVVGATATYNFLAGCNGLEAGQGILILTAMALVAYFTGYSWISVVALCMVFALMAFLIFNFYPAKVFPGDSLTYAAGSLIAALAIVGNFERVTLFFFVPYILETLLKSRGRLKKYSFGKIMPDGSLDLHYSGLYSLNHVAIALMKKMGVKATERRVVICIWLFQLVIIVLGFVIFRQGIFNSA
ncbi:MAG: UDP-N-acetylglucosamine-dolichyl-phosphateN-acetylglucosaminephosphotransferase [Parcubacteria group bacterium GW2011_GWA1_36_12]|nr:MAG: UDP-N-acetylglucosamine-dolichyl-phosphateN-acetylglucosaminephosphotransferase [Parcubacteria group bacterium GW2011_GWA1_36_12]